MSASPTAGSTAVNSNLPIYHLINNGVSAAAAAASTASSTTADANITSQLGPSAFLKLLTTELSNQDPLKPQDQTATIAQLAQFSALQASDNLQASFSNFQSNFAVLQSAALIGKTVSVNTTDADGNSSTLVGKVQAVQVIKGTPSVTIIDPATNAAYADKNGAPLTFGTGQITAIGS